ncbi:hypothetical protein [Sphingorhabdus sp. YGSMI21]|uniref:hypothetical protein n=1 Tax=Sphingorhabdus sp. YGSMI21 TaxID=2077182 RepID=UPI000C1F849A|nr:hypothetical protein [Sphingorhabdus sp. YGSMI21]ATW03822.1 hypothetical protein CHN51_09965 [Sphingorhabdus sp. YGSMI21]
MTIFKFDKHGFLWEPNLHDRWVSRLILNSEQCIEIDFTSSHKSSAVCLSFVDVDDFQSVIRGPRIFTELFVSGNGTGTENDEISIMESLVPKEFGKQIIDSYKKRENSEKQKTFLVLAMMDGYVSFWFTEMFFDDSSPTTLN